MPFHHRHLRFLAALAFGLALGAAVSAWLDHVTAVLAGFDAFAMAYLALIAAHARHQSAAQLRVHAEDEDEGAALVLALAVLGVVVSLWALWLLMRHGAHSAPVVLLGLAAVPLGWAMLHSVAALRYAHLYYAARGKPPLDFPGGDAPATGDFLYLSMTIGMTAQTSDVAVTTPRLRRAVLAHAALSFFYNTVLLALAVNAGLALLV